MMTPEIMASNRKRQVLTLIERRFTGMVERLAWLRTPLQGFDGKTPAQLIQVGRIWKTTTLSLGMLLLGAPVATLASVWTAAKAQAAMRAEK